MSDASSVSQDHAVSIEPFLADQIEVLRVPSTLLFGSGAIGGVVNMVSPTIPQEIPEEGYSGRVTAHGNTAADEEFAADRLELGQGAFALHLDGFTGARTTMIFLALGNSIRKQAMKRSTMTKKTPRSNWRMKAEPLPTAS